MPRRSSISTHGTLNLIILIDRPERNVIAIKDLFARKNLANLNHSASFAVNYLIDKSKSNEL